MIKNFATHLLLINLAMLTSMFIPAIAQNNTTDKSKKEKQEERKERINKMIMQEEEGALIYQKQNIFGIKLNSDGRSLLYEKGYAKTLNKTNLFSFEIGERRDRKEQRVSKNDYSSFYQNNPFVFGKQNNFFFVKLGVGQSYLIGGKGNKNGVAVSAIYAGGLSVGVLKPYYLDVVDQSTNRAKAIKWLGDSSQNDLDFLDPRLIEGSSGLFKGFNELKIKPGVFAKGAIRFDYGRYNELISAIETGANVEFYSSDMPIMVLNKPKKFFINIFVALEFGKRK